MLLQDHPRKGPFSCIPARSCMILRDLAGMQEKGPFLEDLARAFLLAWKSACSIPYSRKFLEGKIFGNLLFTNTLEINFWKPYKISDFPKKADDKHVETVEAVFYRTKLLYYGI